MPKINSPAEMADSLSAPLEDLIAAVGRGVAQAQRAMDMQTMETFKTIYGTEGSDVDKELRQVGYQPTWYKIPEAEAEITISLSISGEMAPSGGGEQQSAAPQGQGRIKLYAAPVDANYTNRYNFDLKAASRVKFRIVPVPPTAQTSEMKIVPDLAGKTYREAKDMLEQLDIPYQSADPTEMPNDLTVVSKAEPGAGQVLTTGQAVMLSFART